MKEVRTVKIMNNDFYSSFICCVVLELLCFIYIYNLSYDVTEELKIMHT